MDVRWCSKFLRQGKCVVRTDSMASSLADWSRGGGHSRTQGQDDRVQTWEHTNVSQEQLPPPTPEKMSKDTFHHNTRCDERQIWTAGSTHQNTRHLQQYKLNMWMRHTKTTSSGCKTREVNLLRWTKQNRVSGALNSKNIKAQIFLLETYVYFWRKDQRETKGSNKGVARVLCAETRRDNEKRRIHRTASLVARRTKTRGMRVAQSSSATDEGRSRHN